MNDEELGHALGTALTGPDLHAVPTAGARLRARAARDRTRRTALGAAAAVVAVLLAVGLVRWVAPAPAPTAATWSGGPARLTEPLRFSAAVPVPAITCPSDGPIDCRSPEWFRTVDEVLDLRVVEAEIRVTLAPEDLAVVRSVAGRSSPAARVRIGGAEHPLTLRGAEVAIAVPDRAAGEAMIDALGPVPPPVPRPGPGPLTGPLELWVVDEERFSGLPCWYRPVDASTMRAFDTADGCVAVTGPPLRFESVDGLRVLDGGRVEVVPVAADRAALRAFTTRYTGRAVAYVVDGRMLEPMPVIQAPFSESLEIGFPDHRAATSFAARLRS